MIFHFSFSEAAKTDTIKFARALMFFEIRDIIKPTGFAPEAVVYHFSILAINNYD